MNLKEKINFDYDNARGGGHRLLSYALEDLMTLTKRRLNQSELLDSIEDMIESKGKMIIKKSRKRKNIEDDVYQMVIFNNYMVKFRFDDKRRDIVLDHNDTRDHVSWDRKNEIEPKLITYRRLFFNFLNK